MMTIESLSRGSHGNIVHIAVRVSNSCGRVTTLPIELKIKGNSADFNEDGGVDGSDVQAFFEAWEAADCAP